MIRNETQQRIYERGSVTISLRDLDELMQVAGIVAAGNKPAVTTVSRARRVEARLAALYTAELATIARIPKIVPGAVFYYQGQRVTILKIEADEPTGCYWEGNFDNGVWVNGFPKDLTDEPIK